METSNSHLVGVAIPTLRQLRAAILKSGDATDAVEALREAGYAGGESIHFAFERWLSETGNHAENAGDLPLSDFSSKASTFFRDAGWGDVQFSHDDDDSVAIVDIADCWEGSSEGSDEDPGCQLTTGMLAAFFGIIAGYPVAVLETECCHGESARCRFVMGNAEIMSYKWQEMQQAG